MALFKKKLKWIFDALGITLSIDFSCFYEEDDEEEDPSI
jgi:hypothetical protein